jgi:hypothetical protein
MVQSRLVTGLPPVFVLPTLHENVVAEQSLTKALYMPLYRIERYAEQQIHLQEPDLYATLRNLSQKRLLDKNRRAGRRKTARRSVKTAASIDGLVPHWVDAVAVLGLPATAPSADMA